MSDDQYVSVDVLPNKERCHQQGKNCWCHPAIESNTASIQEIHHWPIGVIASQRDEQQRNAEEWHKEYDAISKRMIDCEHERDALQWSFDECMQQYNIAQRRACDAEAELAQVKAAQSEDAKTALLHSMSEFSEDAYCAGWMMGLENACKDIVAGKLNKFGMLSGENFEVWKQELIDLHQKADGWWIWNDSLAHETFVPDAPPDGDRSEK